MTRFNNPGARPVGRSPVQTTTRTRNAAGGPGWDRTDKSELFLLAVANFVGQDTFYERAQDRDDRFSKLVGRVAVEDPEWTSEFLHWLRTEANMRTASIVGAVEFVHARLKSWGARHRDGGDGYNRKVVDSVLRRADEPGELLAYWTSKYGRSIPKPVKRGVADAVKRLYNEYSLLKYDTASKGYRFGDVIELVHPTPANSKASWQGDLFKHAIDRRHDRVEDIPASLGMIQYNGWIRASVRDIGPDYLLDPEHVSKAGMTWEDTLSLVGNKVPKDKLWEATIPSMGYMALLRNLRNFDEAGVSYSVANKVASKLSDPEQVAKSRQFPFRFLSAYKATESLRWAAALEEALQLSLSNVPSLKGRTLILVDRSGSMFGGGMWSWNRSSQDLDFADKAAIFGSAVSLRAEDATLVEFGTSSREVSFRQGASVLKMLDKFTMLGGTNTRQAVRDHYQGHDRVIIVTDEQGWGYRGDPVASVPDTVPVYTWNLAGYAAGHSENKGNRHTFGGLTDKAFQMIPLLEAGRNADWPWTN